MTTAARRWSLPVGLAVALVAGLLTAVPASAAVSAPAGLSPSGTQQSASPVLSWSRVDAAAKYEVQAASTSDFAAPQYSVSTTNNRAVPLKALSSGAAFWRVRGISSTNEASAWATTSFTVSAAAAPQPTTPANGASLLQPQNPPLLSWQAVPGAVGYTVDVDNDGDFIGVDMKSYTTKSTSYVVPDPKSGGDYFWRVRAQLANGLSTANSSEWSFQIADLTGVVTTAPAENASVEDVVLKWNPVPGAKTYDLLVSTDQDFNTIIDTKTGIRSTQYSPLITYLNDQYYWKVRPRNNLDETIEWANVGIHNFRRNWPQAPALVYPADQLVPSVGGDLYFQWSPVKHATRYQLDVGDDPNFSPNTYSSCITAGTTYTSGATTTNGGNSDPCFPGQGTVQYWRVKALDDPKGVQGIYSPIRKFVYDSGRVTLTAPTAGAIVSVPTLSWEASPVAERYRVTITGGSGFELQKDTYALSFTPSTSALDPAKSPYAWTVQTIAPNGSVSPFPAGRPFTVSGTPPTSARPPLDPIAGDGGPATVRFPKLSWEPQALATSYKVLIGVAGSGFWFNEGQSAILADKFPYPSATDTGKGILSPGQYNWVIQAFDKDNILIGQSARTGLFTIADPASVTGQQVALSGTSLDANHACTAYLAAPAPAAKQCADVPNTPVLDWAPVPEASMYMVYVAQDRELTNMVYTGVVTTNTRWTPSSANSPSVLADSQAGQAYYWLIRPCKAVNVCAPDPISTDQAAGHAFTKKSPAVVLGQPAEGSTVATSQVAFTWNDYLDTSQATVFSYGPGQGEAGNQAGKQYRVQVSQSPSFATLIDNLLVDQPTYTAYTKTYPEGSLYWRVQAVDANNNGLTWSPVRTFTKASAAPSLTAPVNGSTTSGVSPFSWAATNFAGSYKLEVYKNNDVNLSTVNRVVSVTTKQTAYAAATPLPASTLPYLWRVARLDADARQGLWSPVRSFVSKGSQPSLLTPTTGQYLNGYSSYFAWSAVPGAVNYKFERKLTTASTAAETVTTAATAYAPLASLASGSWQWRVTALDVTNSILGTTEWRPFTVDNNRGLFTAVTPRRVLDTRAGVGAAKRKVGAGQTLSLTIPNLPASTTAVALNVTVAGPTATSFLTVFPAGGTAPTASNLNYVAGQTVPNMVTVAVAPGGKVSFRNKFGSVDVLADLAGYYTPVARSGFRAQSPSRVLDTRIGLGAPKAKVGPGQSVTLQIPGLPANATAVAMNVTATEPTTAGFVTVYPTGAAKPNASNLNFVANQTVPNMVVVAVGAGGKVTFNNAKGSVHLLADVAGYYQPDQGATFRAQAPTRVLDTRSGVGAKKAKVGAGSAITVTIPGLPAGTTAVVLNVTATGPTASSYATVYPGGQAKPTASNLNYLKGQTVPNMVTVSVGAGGTVNLANAFGTVDFIADLAGAYIGP